MYVDKHIIYGLIFSALLFPLMKWNVIIVFLASVLIDFDHYVWCIFKKRNFNLIKCIKFHMKDTTPKIFFMHTVEFLLITLALTHLDFVFLYIAIGFGFHMILDISHAIRYKHFARRRFSYLF